MAVAGALGQWTSDKNGGMAWRIQGQGQWLGSVAAGNGHSLFELPTPVKDSN